MFGRIAGAAGTVCAGAALLVMNTIGVHAQEVLLYSDNISVVGLATITSDNDGDAGAIDLVGGSGSFTFSSLACAANSDPNGAAPEVGLCGATAGGTYNNVVCGTGEAQGSATVNSAVESGTASFDILFAGTVGVLVGSWNSVGPDAEDVNPEQIVGVVNLGPGTAGAGGDNTGDCTSQFSIVANIIAIDVAPVVPAFPVHVPAVPPIVG